MRENPRRILWAPIILAKLNDLYNDAEQERLANGDPPSKRRALTIANSQIAKLVGAPGARQVQYSLAALERDGFILREYTVDELNDEQPHTIVILREGEPT